MARFIDDEWRQLLEDQGWYPKNLYRGGRELEQWFKPGQDAYVVIDHLPEGEPFFEAWAGDERTAHGHSTEDLQQAIFKPEEPAAPHNPELTDEEAEMLKGMGIRAAEGEFTEKQIQRRTERLLKMYPPGTRVVNVKPGYGEIEGESLGVEYFAPWAHIPEVVIVKWDDTGRTTQVYAEDIRPATGQKHLFARELYNFATPFGLSDQIARELVKAGLDFDLDAETLPERAVFSFASGEELELAYGIIQQAFRKQIESGGGGWDRWKFLKSLHDEAVEPERDMPYVAAEHACIRCGSMVPESRKEGSLLRKTALNVPKLIKDFKDKLLPRVHSDHSAPPIPGVPLQYETPEDADKAAEKYIDLVSKSDPTPNKEYTAWLVGNYARGGIARWEDIFARAIPALKRFHALKLSKKIPNEERDIGRIRGLDGLETLIEKYTQVETTSKTRQEADMERQFFSSGQAELVHDDSLIRVVVPKTQETACYFGINTRWCTTQRSGGYFESYSKRGPLYIVLIKPNNERYQFHFQSNQFMDEKDKAIDTWELVGEYPILKDIFNDVAAATDVHKPHQLDQNITSDALAFVKKPTTQMMLNALDDDPTIIDYFPDAPKEVKWKAFEQRVGVSEYKYDKKAKVWGLQEWPNIEEFVEERGGRVAEWAAGITSGDKWPEIEAYAKGDNMEEALNACKPGTIAEINEYIKFHHADELAEWRASEGEDAGDPLDEKDIVRFASDTGQSEIEHKIMSGWYSGQEAGMQDEIIAALKSALQDLRNEGTKYGTAIVWDDKKFWDSPVREVLTLAAAEGLVKEYPNDTDILNSTLQYSGGDEIFEIEEPYHGFNGWSDEAADERISEEFHISDKERAERGMLAPKKTIRGKKPVAASDKEAGPKSRALLPAALLGLGLAPAGGGEASIRPTPPPIVQQAEKKVTLDQLVEAIGRTEGSDPDLHNPGNLVGFHSGEIMRFKNDAQGVHALKKTLGRIADGQNPKFQPDMTLEQAGLVYSGGDPNWAKNVSQILGVDLRTPFIKLIKGTAKIASWSEAVFRMMAKCPDCRNALRHASILRLIEHLKKDHNVREEAQAIASEAFKRISEGRNQQKPVMAGAWGERSYDNDGVHDILDRHRPKGSKEKGFDEPIPEENVEALLDDADELIVSSDTADDKERFFGVMTFLETHGTKLDADHKQMAVAVGRDLMNDREYLGRWDNPPARKLQLKRELRLFGEQTSLLPSIVAAEHNEPDDPACTCGHTFYHHAGEGCDMCKSCPGFDPLPIEGQVDYVCERRSFDRKDDRKNPATYERHDGEMILKVYFKDDKVEKAEFASLGRDGQWHEDFRNGWDGFISYTSSWGD